MPTFTEIKGFLDANSYRNRESRQPDPTRGLHPFVTISRQYGAGGRQLAATILEALARQEDPVFHDWKIFDREMCEAVIDDPRLRDSVQALIAEEYHSELESIILSLLGGRRSQPAAFEKLFEAIRSLATLGKVIIVGRAGVCVTNSLPLGVHIRLIGSETERIRRMELGHLRREEALHLLERKDEDRSRLVRSFFHQEIDDPLLYEGVFNTDRISFPVLAGMTVELLKARMAYRDKSRLGPKRAQSNS